MKNYVAHFDIPVSDTGKSTKYYQDLFGWKIDEIPGMNYSLVYTADLDPVTKKTSQAGAINGGMAQVSEAGDIHQAYFTVEVDDVKAMLDKAVAMGGKIIRPYLSGDWGDMAVFADPDGNIIGLHHA